MSCILHLALTVDLIQVGFHLIMPFTFEHWEVITKETKCKIFFGGHYLKMVNREILSVHYSSMIHLLNPSAFTGLGGGDILWRLFVFLKTIFYRAPDSLHSASLNSWFARVSQRMSYVTVSLVQGVSVTTALSIRHTCWNKYNSCTSPCIDKTLSHPLVS